MPSAFQSVGNTSLNVMPSPSLPMSMGSWFVAWCREQAIMSDRVANRSPEEVLGILDHHRPRIEEIARKKILASEPQDEYVIIPSDF